ncbi:MAG: SusC/RagA family TonB-linked outer membrane protein [Chitinophagaceae bacterium]|nr:SusC/RagA family TonB-linked outer membrane protein [Chitinophagaceae bacterium]
MKRFISLFVPLLIIVLSLISMNIEAQTSAITGTVLSDDGTPLSGVTIAVKGKPQATTTNNNGVFTIIVSIGESLEVSYVGYQPQTFIINNFNSLQITLSKSAEKSQLDEVVVVGYGTQRKSNVTGAVTSVDIDKTLGSRPIADVGRGLQGAVPGLSVRVPSGEVGSDPLIRIRGFVGSIAGSSLPLILVNNVEIPSIQMINPNDIEEITILKDASATSIYGAKAAFGVILITTKKGSKVQGNKLSYSGNFSWQDPAKKLEIAGIDGLQYTLDAHKNMKASGPAGGFWRISEESLQKAREWDAKYGSTVGKFDPVVYNRDWYWDGTDKYGIRIYDPIDAMVKKNAFTQNHNLSLNGKSGNTMYNVGLGYLNQQGMMKPAAHDDFTRYTANLSLSTKVTDFLTIRGGALYSDRTKRYPNSFTGFVADPWLYLYRWSLSFPTGVKELGEIVRDPYWDTKYAHTAISGNKYTNLNLGTTIDVAKNWQVIADYTYDINENLAKSSRPTYSAAWTWYGVVPRLDENGNQVYVDQDGNVTETGGVPAYKFPMTLHYNKDQTYIYQSTTAARRHTVNAYTTYNLNLNDYNKFKITLGSNIVSNKWNNHWSNKTNLINENNPQFNFAVGTETTGGDANWDSQLGYFGRLNYAYDNKYLLEANLRYDGTSKFPAYLRWKWYPSFSAGWVLSEEKFLNVLKPVLSFAKLRGSWGSIGDQSVSNSLYLSNISIGKNEWLSSAGNQFFQLGTPNPISAGITWQDIVTLNLGADIRMFKDKFGITFDYFNRETRNMIIPGEALPATFGAAAPQGNYGNLMTKGFELSLDYRHRFESGLGINIMANLSDAVTDITKAADWNTPWENRLIDNTFTTGKRYGDIYGYVTDRLFQKDDFVYDANGNFVQEVIVWNGTAKRTNKLAGPNPVYQTNFEDGNQILLISPGDVRFVDVNGDGYITAGKGTFGDPGDRVVIGNMLPRYEYGFRLGLDYRSFDFSLMGQGVGRRHIWGEGQLAIPGYHVKDGAMPEAIAANYWREDRTDAFYPRAWNLNGASSGFVMVPQTRYLLNMAYFRIKNITLGYNVAPQILNRVQLKQARIYLSLENFITFDKLRGLPIDPEAISGVSMLASNYNLGRTGTNNPTFKIVSLGINITL